MATIKKGLKKAQNGDNKVKFNRSIGPTYESTKNPNSNFKIKTIDKGVNEVRNFDTDTTGYSAGKKEFMGKLTRSPLKGSGKTKTTYFTADRSTIKDAIDKGYNKKTNIAMKNGGPVKKAQTGGTYYATSEGRVGRLSGSSIGDVLADIRNESIDTTGYSKGKKEFKKIRNSSAEGKTVKKVKREEVKKVISDLKKGATRKMDLRTLDQRKKSKMRNGGSLSGLKASAKRVGPVDPKGAFTKVQKKTLKGAKGKASLTKDKQLGATKMAKRGMSIKKK